MSEYTYSDDPACPGWAELRPSDVNALAVRHLALWWRGEYRHLHVPAHGHEPVSWRHLRFVCAGEGHVAEGRAHLDALTDAALERDSTWTPCRLVATGEYRVQPVARAWVDWTDLPQRVRETVETTCFREGRPLPWEHERTGAARRVRGDGA